MFRSIDEITEFLKLRSVDLDRERVERELLDLGADPDLVQQAAEAWYAEGETYYVPPKNSYLGRDSYRVPAIAPRRSNMVLKATMIGVAALGVVTMVLVLVIMTVMMILLIVV